MKAMVLEKQNQPLKLLDVPIPQPRENQLLLKVNACGLCRTDLHILDGELNEPQLPLILGHQIVGTVVEIGKGVKHFQMGERIGVPWLGSSCGNCRYCTSQRENLCDHAQFTGYHLNGGCAEYTVADANFCFSLPDHFPDEQAAPLLCAGLIGYRCLRQTKKAQHLGIYGFGAAAHILIQVARYQGKKIFAFTKSQDKKAQQFALALGAEWVGGSDESPPTLLDAAIIFAPAGELVPIALRAIAKGGIVVCGGIHMSDIPSFPYEILWGERCICSIANLTRQDGEEFLSLAAQIPIKTEVHSYSLDQLNEALSDLRHGVYPGAYVIRMTSI